MRCITFFTYTTTKYTCFTDWYLVDPRSTPAYIERNTDEIEVQQICMGGEILYFASLHAYFMFRKFFKTVETEFFFVCEKPIIMFNLQNNTCYTCSMEYSNYPQHLLQNIILMLTHFGSAFFHLGGKCAIADKTLNSVSFCWMHRFIWQILTNLFCAKWLQYRCYWQTNPLRIRCASFEFSANSNIFSLFWLISFEKSMKKVQMQIRT